jgi:hypothetical protein
METSIVFRIIDTSFSVMAEMVKVEHAASLFLGPDGHSKQASGMFYNAN